MPKSKRQKIVSLTKTESKGRADKEALFEQIRTCADEFNNIFVFSVENMRNYYLKDIRNEWKSSRFFFGKNKVMAKALGNTEEEEYKEKLHHIADALIGDVGLLFTNKSVEEVKKFFEDYKQQDYPRSGYVATDEVVIPSGPVKRGAEDSFPHNMEPQLRGLGMPTMLKNGIVTLPVDYTICKVGDTLTPHQAQLLKLFYIQMAEFQVQLKCAWTNGEFEEF
ncbi:mRNA turnover and ribosome assembly protein [Basidiobolus ranarum]|uniref:Ribosome assembly factor mrt4 n=1 Tax=Basidiobolus ranarum TaxID=34480 RepID=A0ABR2WTS8_9FUNG